MRNDEAINWLKLDISMMKFDPDTGEEAYLNDYARNVMHAEEMAIEALKAQKVGHWEYVQYDYNPNIGNWHCSECRNIVIECADKNKDGGIPTYSYCPKCGARMEVQE